MNRYSEYELEVLKTVYPKYGSYGVQEHIDRTELSVTKKASRLGIKVNSDFRDSKFDVQNFLKPNNYKYAYILGLLWGDGYITKYNKKSRNYRVVIGLIKKDFTEIEGLFQGWKIKDRICSKYPKTWKPFRMASLSSKSLHTFLRDNDFLEKSIKTPSKILSKIPSRLHKYFFRGWIDADGCLTRLLKNKYVVTVSGSYHQDWSEFKKISKKLGFKYKISKSIAKNGNKSSYVYIGGKESVMKFLKHVYSGLPIGLSRKSKIYKGLGE